MGKQPLYTVSVIFTPFSNDGQTEISSSRRIGFRHAVLVTGNDTDPEYIRNAMHAEGSGGDAQMFFRINGAVVVARGANVVPMEEMEGRMSDEAHRQLVHSAVAANMNMLRVCAMLNQTR